ncbi:MAG: alpha-E domain-containing protein [Leptospiraceae bacterium]|nr:alpha-E domain-containing protein [Leptospiraceae bacterium]
MMLSRIAESLYWLGRLIERAQGISISLQVQHSASLESSDYYDQKSWEPILNAVGQLNTFFAKHKYATQDEVIDYLVFDAENQNSILSCINKARENARGVRDMISKETWEIINITFHEFNNFNMDVVRKEGPDSFFHFIRNKGYLIDGATEITMFRGTGYHFMNVGKYMERADQIARILDVKYHIPLRRVEDVGNPVDIYQWRTLLDSTGAYEAYTKYYTSKIVPIQVAELLIFNRQIPRSLLFCMEHALESLREITPVKERFFANSSEQKIGKLYYNLAYTDIEEVFFFGLHEYLTNFINDLITIGLEMNHTYFGYS